MKEGPVGLLAASTWGLRREEGLTEGYGPGHMEGCGRHPSPFTGREEGPQENLGGKAAEES